MVGVGHAVRPDARCSASNDLQQCASQPSIGRDGDGAVSEQSKHCGTHARNGIRPSDA